MNKITGPWSIFILFSMLHISSVTYADVSPNNQQKKPVSANMEPEKVRTQLERARELMVQHPEQAKSIADSAQLAAHYSGNKTLQMISFYTLGSIALEQRNAELAQSQLDSALSLANALNDEWYKSEIYYRLGVLYHRSSETLKALETLYQSVTSSLQAENYRTAGSAYSILGTIFRINGMYDRAIEYIIKSRLNYSKAGLEEGSAWAAYLLGRIYYDLQLPKKAQHYYMESLDIYRELSLVDGDKNGLALCYEQLAIIEMEAGNYQQARQYVEHTAEIYSGTESKYGMSNVKTNHGKIEYYEGNHTLAEMYLTEALQMKKEINDQLGQPRVYTFRGLNQLASGQTREGIQTIQQGLELAILNNQKKVQLDIYARLTAVYMQIGDFKNAILSQNKQIEIQDSILSGAATIKAEQLQAIYEIDEKNNQIANLEKQNKIIALSNRQNKFIRNIMISGIVLTLLIALIIYGLYTKIKIKNHELHEANSAKNKFFAIIAHDLRGPIGSLAGLLELIHSNFNDFSTAELKNKLTVLYKSAENVSNLLENLLIWAHSQVEKIEYRPAEINLNDLLSQVIFGMKSQAENKQINVQLECREQIIVMADPDMAQTIVRNILGNAIKYSYRGNSVFVEAALQNDNTAVVKVRDQGVGIEQQNVSKLFEINSKHHTPGTEDEKSTGLGLILVKDFVERNKGTLSIDSETGKGTIVSFTLPLANNVAGTLP